MPQDFSRSQDDTARIEAWVRSAALQAAKGASLGEAVLARIVAETSQPGLSIAQRLLRATTMAEQYVASPKPLNFLSATPEELNAQARSPAFLGTRIPGAQTIRSQEAGKATTTRDYQTLASGDARALQSVTSANFAGSPFALAGINYGTFSYLRGFDRSLTGQNILNAANDAKALGFKATDRAAMLDHAVIDRYDPKARATNRSLQQYQQAIEGDEQLASLHDQKKHATTPDARKAIDAEIAARRGALATQSGLSERLHDSTVPPKATAATTRRKTAIEKKAERSYEARAAVRHTTTPPPLKSSASGADLFKKLTASPK